MEKPASMTVPGAVIVLGTGEVLCSFHAFQ